MCLCLLEWIKNSNSIKRLLGISHQMEDAFEKRTFHIPQIKSAFAAFIEKSLFKEFIDLIYFSILNERGIWTQTREIFAYWFIYWNIFLHAVECLYLRVTVQWILTNVYTDLAPSKGDVQWHSLMPLPSQYLSQKGNYWSDFYNQRLSLPVPNFIKMKS